MTALSKPGKSVRTRERERERTMRFLTDTRRIRLLCKRIYFLIDFKPCGADDAVVLDNKKHVKVISMKICKFIKSIFQKKKM